MKMKYVIWMVILCLGFLLVPHSAAAQGGPEKPPKPLEVTVSNLQNLNFGTFSYSDGSQSTVSISPDGMRTSTGSVLLLGGAYTAALFEVQALPGTIISILNGPDAILTGSSGGEITLKIGSSFPASPFIATSRHTTLTIGGTLLLGPASTSGFYSGSFTIMFMQE
jgi:hypothetical protein